MDDLVQRLHALSRYTHDDRSIGDEAADEIERLTAERDSLSLAYKTSENDVFNLTQKVIPNLRAERDALQADAARYRWLRDMDEDPICSLAAMWTDCKGSALSISKRVDAAVDAHRGKNTT